MTGPDPYIRLSRDEQHDLIGRAVKSALKTDRRKGWLVTLCTCLIIGIIAGLLVGKAVSDHGRTQQHREDAYVCQVLRVDAGVLSRFVTSDAALRVESAKLSITRRLLHDIERVIPLGDLETAESAGLALNDQFASLWTTKYLPPLKQLVNLNCEAALGAAAGGHPQSVPSAPTVVSAGPTGVTGRPK